MHLRQSSQEKETGLARVREIVTDLSKVLEEGVTGNLCGGSGSFSPSTAISNSHQHTIAHELDAEPIGNRIAIVHGGRLGAEATLGLEWIGGHRLSKEDVRELSRLIDQREVLVARGEYQRELGLDDLFDLQHGHLRPRVLSCFRVAKGPSLQLSLIESMIEKQLCHPLLLQLTAQEGQIGLQLGKDVHVVVPALLRLLDRLFLLRAATQLLHSSRHDQLLLHQTANAQRHLVQPVHLQFLRHPVGGVHLLQLLLEPFLLLVLRVRRCVARLSVGENGLRGAGHQVHVVQGQLGHQCRDGHARHPLLTTHFHQS